MIILIPHKITQKCILTLQKYWNPISWVPCCYVLYFFKYAYSSNTLKILKFHNKDPNGFAIIFLVLNAVFITEYHSKAVQDDISEKNFLIWLHHTVYIRVFKIPKRNIMLFLWRLNWHRNPAWQITWPVMPGTGVRDSGARDPSSGSVLFKCKACYIHISEQH